MNKYLIVIFLSMASMSFNTFSYAAKDKIKSKVEIKKTPIKKLPETYDFRKIRWGMNRSQIVSAEKSQPQLEIDNKLTYKETMFEKNVNINYFFEDTKLIKSEYLFDDNFDNGADYVVYYKKIKKNLIEKYGKPTINKSEEIDIVSSEKYKYIFELLDTGAQDYETIWNTPRTVIKLGLRSKKGLSSVKLFVTYNSKKFKEIDNVKEVEKSLF